VIVGALSTIAVALARRFAAEGAHVVLAARGGERLDQLRADIKGRGAATATGWPLDLAAVEDCGDELGRMATALGGDIDAVVVIYGTLGDQRTAEADIAELDRIVAVNFASAARWCVAAAAILERQKAGVLLAVSSVAGDRGRQSNYVYGAAKAGLTVLVEGIAHRLAPSGAHAVVAKLGFVDTAMTAHIPGRGGLLWAQPDAVAESLRKIIEKPRSPVVYLPWFWRFIMMIIRNVPARVFHKTKL
jgi:short-subunit dehydrogenase